MLVDRDQYLHEFAADALQIILRILQDMRPGALIEFSVLRSEAGDWVSIRFTLDARPGVEFTYRHPALSAGTEPQLSASSASGILMSSLIERTEFKAGQEAIGGIVEL